MNNKNITVTCEEIHRYISSGFSDEMIQVIQSLLQDCQRDVSLDISLLELKAYALHKIEDYKGELDVINKILKIDEKNEKALIVKGSLLSMSQFNSLHEAIFFINKALGIRSDNLHALGQKGAILFEMKEYNESLKIFDLILDNDKNNIYFLNEKGRCLFMLNRHEEALNIFNKILNLDSNYEHAIKNKEMIQALIQNKT